MDTITHTVLGACTGELIAGRKMGKKAMLVGAIVNNLPDIDMVGNFWTTQAQGLLTHRGLTHSFFFLVLVSPLLAWLTPKIFRKAGMSFRQWLWLISHGLLLHIVLDACTTYGTGWFEPFSHYRVSFNTLFILDPFFMLPMLIGAIVLLVLNKNKIKARSIVSATALSMSLLYLISCICIKLYVNKVFRREYTFKKIEVDRFIGSPTPMNNLMWYSLAQDKKGDYYVGYYSILDEDTHFPQFKINRNDSLLNSYRQNIDVQRLIRFCKQYYTLKKIDGGVQISDMRFGQIGTSKLDTAPFVFNFDLLRSADRITVRQSEFKAASGADFKRLIERIKGKR
jgi:inner membrane protein